MARITEAELWRVDLTPKTARRDAIQSFVSQQTPILKLRCDDGSEGVGYSYTIGTGGSAVVALLADDLLPALIGSDPDHIEHIWRRLAFCTHATTVGAITSLALAAIDTALWDRRARCAGLPLWQLAGGAQDRVPVYTTEGGWLQLEPQALVEQTLAARDAGFLGAKLKVGKPRLDEDVRRLTAVRDAVGADFELMVDANQAFTLAEALRRAAAFEPLRLAWLEEPLPADDIAGHAQLARQSRVPIAVGESIYGIGHFAQYIASQACSVVQVDVARIGGITPWLKVAHLAECHNLAVCPHFLMELHVSLAAAVPNAAWVEHIPQLDDIASSRLQLDAGQARPPSTPGLGIDWDWGEVAARAVQHLVVKTP